MDQIFPALGTYFWWIIAALLLIAEMMAPGFFMIWLAMAAAATAVVHLIAPMAWTSEVLVFALLSAIAMAASWRFVTRSWVVKSDQPNLNQMHHAFVGKTYYLEKPIIDGHGKIKVDDRVWDVMGPDMPKGAEVKVTAVEGLRLRVKQA